MKYEQIIFYIQVHTSVNNVRDTMKNFGLLITLKKKNKIVIILVRTVKSETRRFGGKQIACRIYLDFSNKINDIKPHLFNFKFEHILKIFKQRLT